MGRPANLVVNILGNNRDLLQTLNGSDSGLARFGASVGKTVQGVAVAWTGLAVAAGIFTAKVFNTGIAYNTLNQTATAAFKTILGSSEAATEMMDQIRVFAKSSPFPREAFIEATQQMLGFGISAQKVVPILSAVQDAVAATGGSAAQIGEITSILSKVQSSGKITAQTLNELGQRGIDAATLIGSEMGKSAAQIRSDITAGALDAGQAIDALAAGMTQKFGGAAALVKETWLGARDRVRGALRDIGSAMAEPFVSSAGGGQAVQWANSLADILRALEPIVVALMEKFSTAFSGSLSGISGLLDGVAASIGGFDISSVVAQIGQIGPALAAITGGFAAIAAGAGSSIPLVGGLLGSLASPIGVALAAMAGLVAVSPDLQQMLGGVLQEAMGALRPLLPVVSNALGQMARILGQVVQAAAPLIPIFATALTQALTAVLPVLMKLAEGVLPIVIAAVTTLGPVIDAAAQVFAALMPPLAQLTSALLPPLAELITAVLAAIAPLLPIVGQLTTQFVGVAMKALGPLLPVLGQLIRALTPILAPVAQIIGLLAQLIGVALQLVSPIVSIAAAITGKLLGAFASFVGGAVGAVAGIFGGIASAIGVVVGWMQTLVSWIGKVIDWFARLKPPAFLGGLGGIIGFSTGPDDDYPGPRGPRGFPPPPTSASAYAARFLAAAGFSSGGASPTFGNTYNITVNAPYGGGDEIARSIREELVRLERRDGGVVMAGGHW